MHIIPIGAAPFKIILSENIYNFRHNRIWAFIGLIKTAHNISA